MLENILLRKFKEVGFVQSKVVLLVQLLMGLIFIISTVET